MSSRILTGEVAKAAPPINWSKRGTLYSGAGDETQVQVSQRAQDVETSAEARIAQARDAGRMEGEQAVRAQLTAQVDSMNVRLARALEELSAYKSMLRRDAEQDVVKLAIAIARKVLHREIAADSEALLGLVKVALDKIEAREVHRVRVHPEHSAGIERALQSIGAPRQIEVFGDPVLERGAAVFETSRGSLDVSIETQLREIERGFADLVARR